MAYELITSSDYLRSQETLLVHIDMSGYLIEYYLHRKDHSPDTKAEHDSNLKDLIACFAIHLTARGPHETHAWTVHLVAGEPYSLFVTGSSGDVEEGRPSQGFLVGHVLTDYIRHSDVNGLHAQFTQRGRTFKSYTSSESAGIGHIVEKFYEQSEQRPMRIHLSDNSDTAIGLMALPGCDPEWFAAVNIEELAARTDLDRTPMRQCAFSFSCDCSSEKLLPFFRGLPAETVQELYHEDEALKVTCPRCGRKFTVPRSEVEG